MSHCQLVNSNYLVENKDKCHYKRRRKRGPFVTVEIRSPTSSPTIRNRVVITLCVSWPMKGNDEPRLSTIDDHILITSGIFWCRWWYTLGIYDFWNLKGSHLVYIFYDRYYFCILDSYQSDPWFYNLRTCVS